MPVEFQKWITRQDDPIISRPVNINVEVI